MKISLVLSTYNGAKYIIPQLDSLKNQTRKIDEVIIRDDLSTDETYSIIEKYIVENSLDWSLIRGEENLGWRDAFYELTRLSSGDIIFFCDQDDIWHEKKIEIMSECFNDNDIHLLVADEVRFQYNEIPHKWEIGSLTISKFDTRFTWPYIQRPGCVFAFDRRLKNIYMSVYRKGDAHDLLVWQIAGVLDSIWHIDFNAILFRRHDSNSTPSGVRTLEGRLTDVNNLSDVAQRLESNNQIADAAKLRVKEFLRYLDKRKSFLYSKSLFDFCSLLPQCRYYTSIKAILADVVAK